MAGPGEDAGTHGKACFGRGSFVEGPTRCSTNRFGNPRARRTRVRAKLFTPGPAGKGGPPKRGGVLGARAAQPGRGHPAQSTVVGASHGRGHVYCNGGGRAEASEALRTNVCGHADRSSRAPPARPTRRSPTHGLRAGGWGGAGRRGGPGAPVEWASPYLWPSCPLFIHPTVAIKGCVRGSEGPGGVRLI